MFSMFPYLSIYLQDILGYSPLAAGLRFLPLTCFVFFVPLAMRRVAMRVPLRVMIGGGLALVAGIGIGIANPALAAGALRVVDPARTGMASGINNTFRLGGVAVGVAALGALLEDRVTNALSTTAALGGLDARGLGSAVSSAGLRAVAGHPALVEPAKTAFVSGLDDLLLTGTVVLAVGAVAALTLLRVRAPVPAPAPEPEGPATEPA